MKFPEFVSFNGRNNFIQNILFAVLLTVVMALSLCCTINTKEEKSYLPKNTPNPLDSLFMNSPIAVIKSCINNKALDVTRASTGNNAPVSIYDFIRAGNQLWSVEKVGNGYIIRGWHSKKVLAINMVNYSLVQQDFTGKDHQIWLISGTIDSSRILNRAVRKYLTVGVDIIISDNYSTSPAQLWNFLLLREVQKEITTCNCPQNFEYIRNLIETSYPGFNDKVNTKTKSQYDQLRKLLSEKAGTTQNSASCFKIIDHYLSFFKDNHIQFSMINGYGFGEKPDPVKVRQFYAGSETFKMGENEVRNYFDKNKGKLAPLDGIWEDQTGNYRCAIISNKADGRDFVGFILKADSLTWMPGQVKMDFFKQEDNLYTLFYYMGDHSIMKEKNIEYLSGDTLYERNGKWIRKYPVRKEPRQLLKNTASLNADGFQLKNLDDSTLLLSLPSFDFRNKAIVNNLIKTYQDKLYKIPYLIIDIRGNGGGADDTWNSILPFLYTNPIRVIGNDLLSSKGNIEAVEQWMKTSNKPEDSKVFLRSMIRRMKENPGKFIEMVGDGFVRFDAALSNPRKIAILINNNCASSAEEFLLRAVESKKVILLGQPTSGTLDYSNLIPGKFPSMAFNIAYPLTRTRRLFLVDKEGIKPNVYLTEDQNWIEEAVKYLKSGR